MLKSIREWWTGCYESNVVVMGQPFGSNTTVICACGDVLSSNAKDWVRIEEHRTFATSCPNCGTVECGAW